jgi:ribosomal protein S18 acetylase RimI-like enzyme
MRDLQVRTASPDDWETIVAFNCRLAEETENLCLDPAVIGPGVRSALSDPRKARYFVACFGPEVVGQLMLTTEWSDWRNGDIWWLQSVYVDPPFRRQGVFRELYRHACREADTDPNVVGLRLYVEIHNNRAQDVYRRLGMQEAGYLVMQHMLDE